MTGEIKTRQELAGNVDSPFAIGQQPQNQDFQDLLASALLPGEDTAERLAADPTTISFWLTHFADEDLPEDAQGRKTLVGLLNRLLTWADDRFNSPQTQAIGPSVTYVDADTFSVPADITTTLLVGARVRASLAGLFVYGTVASRSWNGTITTVNLTLDDEEAELTSALDGVVINLIDGALVTNSVVTEERVLEALGYTPADRAGDTFTGPVNAPFFCSREGQIYGKLTVTNVVPDPSEGEDGDIWMIFE